MKKSFEQFFKERGVSMKIINLLKGSKPGVSCELFPPKQGSQLANALEIVDTIAEQKPSFISVTYGAGGSNAGKRWLWRQRYTSAAFLPWRILPASMRMIRESKPC